MPCDPELPAAGARRAQRPAGRQPSSRAQGLAGGPLLLIVIGVVALLVWRFVPWSDWVAGADDGARITGGAVLVERGEPPPPAAIEGAPPEVAAVETPPERAPLPTETAAPAAPPRDALEAQARITAVAPAAEPRSPAAVAAPDPPPAPEPESEPEPKPAPKPAAPVPTPAAPREEPVAPAAAPQPPPARPTLRVLVEADAADRAGLGAYTPAEYAGLLKRELEDVVARQLGDAAVTRGLPNLAFRDHVANGRAGLEALCRKADAERLLLADLVVPPQAVASVPSAYWPEVTLRAVDCADGRTRLRPARRLEPYYDDRFDYQHQFTGIAADFVASQGYFLRP